jgi:hypothetical protein
MAFTEFDLVREAHIGNINSFLQEKWGIDSYKLLVPGVLLQKSPEERRCRVYPLVNNIKNVTNPDDYEWCGVLPGSREGSLKVFRSKPFGDYGHYFDSTLSGVREIVTDGSTVKEFMLAANMFFQLTWGYKDWRKICSDNRVWVFEDKITLLRRQVFLFDFYNEKDHELETSSLRMIEQVKKKVEAKKLDVGK